MGKSNSISRGYCNVAKNNKKNEQKLIFPHFAVNVWWHCKSNLLLFVPKFLVNLQD